MRHAQRCRQLTQVALLGLLLGATGCDVSVDLGGDDPPATAGAQGNAQSAPAPPTAASSPPAQPSSAAPPTWGDVYERVSSGVVRIEGLTCPGTARGSGFLVQDDLVATAAHVVEGVSALSVRAGDQARRAAVLGFDAETDVALLRLHSPVSGHVFAWSDTDPRVGDDIAAVGYPMGQPRAMTRGAVTALDRRIEVEGRDRLGLVQTDAAINPGNSGGPLLTATGEAAGIVSAGSDAPGDAYAVSRDVASDAVERWRAAPPSRTSDDSCTAEDPSPGYEGVSLDVEITSDHPEAPVLAHLLRIRAEAINTGRYETAYQLVTAAVRGEKTLEEFSAELHSSFWRRLDVQDVEVVSDTVDDVEVSFRTQQDAAFGPDGQTCTDWHVTYRMVLDSGYWQVDRSRPLEDPAPCPGEPQEGDL